MRVAVPVWEDRISPVFDSAAKLMIVEIESNKKLREFVISIDPEQELHKRVRLIRELNIDCIICGAISRSFLEMLNSLGVNTICGISGKVKDVIKAYLKNKPFKYLMPGYNIPKGGQDRWRKKRNTKMQGSCRKKK